MSYMYRGTQKNFCTNCGGNGHTFKSCIAPVTSYGVIMVRASKHFSIEESLTSFSGNVTGLEKEQLEFLLIQRRDSLGFIELIRGRDKVQEME